MILLIFSLTELYSLGIMIEHAVVVLKENLIWIFVLKVGLLPAYQCMFPLFLKSGHTMCLLCWKQVSPLIDSNVNSNSIICGLFMETVMTSSILFGAHK